MSGEWYGSLNNRLEENRQFCDEIKVGTGMTEYLWSDRHPYEVVEVTDQKHVKVREMDHEKVGDTPFSNDWKLVSNPKNPVKALTRRGKYWYSVVSITPEEAKEIFEGNNIDDKIWASVNGFDLPEIIKAGKIKRAYHRMNVSFGVAEYHYDYEF